MTLPRFRTLLSLSLLFLALPLRAQQVSGLLDGFEQLAGWTTITSDGAGLALAAVPGKSGNSLEMDFDLRGVSGYVIAEKKFRLDLPADYQFTFDMRAEAPVNNFEFKILDDRENVYWIKKLNVTYPAAWTTQRIKKRHLTFAWGPSPGPGLRAVRAIQFVVSTGTGGKGKVWIDNFRFEPIDAALSAGVRPEFVGRTGKAAIDSSGTVVSGWSGSPSGGTDSLVIDMHRAREVGGLVIDWDTVRYASAYDVLVSDDGKEWSCAYSVRNGRGGRAYIPTGEAEGRFLKLDVRSGHRPGGSTFAALAVKGPEFSRSANTILRAVAADGRAGLFPKYVGGKQSYWTVMGVNGDTKESLINEEGAIEVDREQFTIEPFLFVNGTLITWSDVTTEQSLAKEYLPVPTVRWTFRDRWSLAIEPCVAGPAGASVLGVRYRLSARGERVRGKLFLALRPLQVVPPWHMLNMEGGASRIDSVTYRFGVVGVNRMTVVPLSPPSGFGASEFDRGDITGYLSRCTLPEEQEVHDHAGRASAALAYDVDVAPDSSRDIVVMVPLHARGAEPARDGELARGGDRKAYEEMVSAESARWEAKLGALRLDLPPAYRAVANTLRSNLAYIFINRDRAGIQPGSRTYERSWIRDGALTCSALLRCGYTAEVREFIDWYAGYQFPSGKIPCVVDARGADTVPENDSNGEFLYAVLQYFRFTRDTTWLRGKFSAVDHTVRYIQSLRAQRKTDIYRDGTPEQRSFFGLVPESISHEGYSDVPRHSYWDDFFTLRGLKDAAAIAGILTEKARAAEFAAERDDMQRDLYTSMRLAIQNKHIDYIPGCAELGDFDATSTTIGVLPGGELGNIPEPQLHNTFDRYYRFFVNRKTDTTNRGYTPYEMRVIGTFVLLGQKERAGEALDFFMADRRPAGWNAWAEVVWRDRDLPLYTGDMPHTWVGSDFIRSVLSMFVYERERDGAVVLAAGIPDRWIEDAPGVRATDLRTYDGTISYGLKRTKNGVVADVSASLVAGHRPVLLSSPLSRRLRAVTVNGKTRTVPASGEVLLERFPATVEFRY